MENELYNRKYKGFTITAYLQTGMGASYKQYKISKCNNRSADWRSGIASYQQCIDIIEKHFHRQSKSFAV